MIALARLSAQPVEQGSPFGGDLGEDAVAGLLGDLDQVAVKLAHRLGVGTDAVAGEVVRIPA
jgi:hypothetical protein